MNREPVIISALMVLGVWTLLVGFSLYWNTQNVQQGSYFGMELPIGFETRETDDLASFTAYQESCQKFMAVYSMRKIIPLISNS